MTKVARAGALHDGEGAVVEIETADGPVEIRCTFEDAERLGAALQAARDQVQARRAQAAKAPLAETQRPVARWETAIDPVNQDAVIVARYEDRTAQETRIPRAEVPAIARFLDQAAKRFAAGAEMRQ
jgi:hypothetical protein